MRDGFLCDIVLGVYDQHRVHHHLLLLQGQGGGATYNAILLYHSPEYCRDCVNALFAVIMIRAESGLTQNQLLEMV